MPTSSRLATRPAIVTRPLVGSVMRDRIFSRVDLAGAVAADDAEHLAALDLEAHVLERPELLRRSRRVRWPAAQHVGCLAQHASRGAVTSRSAVSVALGLVADDVFLAEPLGADDDIAGTSDQVRESALGAPEIGDAEPEEHGRRRRG